MLHVGLDLSRKRLDFHALAQDGDTVEVGASPPDRDGLAGLARRLDRHGEPICAAIESSCVTPVTWIVKSPTRTASEVQASARRWAASPSSAGESCSWARRKR